MGREEAAAWKMREAMLQSMDGREEDRAMPRGGWRTMRASWALGMMPRRATTSLVSDKGADAVDRVRLAGAGGAWAVALEEMARMGDGAGSCARARREAMVRKGEPEGVRQETEVEDGAAERLADAGRRGRDRRCRARRRGRSR